MNDRRRDLVQHWIDRADLVEILRLRLLVCRAAAADSLRWWNDSSLTDDGAFVLKRVFPRSSGIAARRLALGAALLRHEAALEGIASARHLFDLGAEVEIALEEIPLDEPDIPGSSITDVETLLSLIGSHERRDLSQLSGGVVPVPIEQTWGSPVLWAVALAAAYTLGRPGEPVFPVIVAPGSQP